MMGSKATALTILLVLMGLLLAPLLGAPGVKAEDTNWWAITPKVSGGHSNYGFYGVAVAPNGDIIVVGWTNASGAGGKDAWVLRLDENGNVKWQKTYGGIKNDVAVSVGTLSNGNIVVVGGTKSFGAGSADVWVLCLDENGNVKWQKTFGGKYYDTGEAVAIDSNDNIIVVAETTSFGLGNREGGDVWILRLDANGNVKWQKTYGGDNTDWAWSIEISPNRDILLAGYTISFGSGGSDAWVLRLDENGNVKWQKTYGGIKNDVANSIVIAPNGDIIVIGSTQSFGSGDSDIWVLRLDGNGNIKWQKTYGSGYREGGFNGGIAPNGDIIVAGSYLLRLSPEGSLKWATTIGSLGFKILPDGTIVTATYGVGRLNVDTIPSYTNTPWKMIDLNVSESNAQVSDTNALVKTSNAEIHETNAEVRDTNVEFSTVWTYTPAPTNVLNHEVTIVKKVASSKAPAQTVTNKTATVKYNATTTVYEVKVKVNGVEKPGYLVQHNVSILNVQGNASVFRTIYNVSKSVAYSVDDMILPPNAVIIQREPVIALDIKDPKAGEEVNQTVILLTNVSESKFMQGVKITHEVLTSSTVEKTASNEGSKGICGPALMLALALGPVALIGERKRQN